MSLQKGNVQTVPAATPAKLGATKPTLLKGFLLFGGSAATSVEFKNAASDTGDVLLSANVAANESLWVDLEQVGGIMFGTAIFCKPAGTGAICYAFFC